MTVCPRFESALLDRAAGVLEPAKLSELEEHLKACAACAQEADALKDSLELASLPPLTPREQMALATLPVSTMRAWRAAEKRRQIGWGVTLGAGIAAAAAAALFLLPMRVHSVRRIDPRADRNQLSDDATVRALESWGMGGALVELSPDTASGADGLEGTSDDDDEGVGW